MIARVLIVSGSQWMRAGLRAELRERGFDAVGARDLAEAARYARPVGGRGPVGLVLVDQLSLGDELDAHVLERLRDRLGAPLTVLVAPGNREAASGDWTAVLRRPISIGEIADYVGRVIPNARADAPLDD